MWENITVGMFQQLTDIITGQNFDDEMERSIKLLSCLEGMPIDYYESMTLNKLVDHCKRIKFLHTEDVPLIPPPKEININGYRFKVMYDFGEITGGQFIDVMTSAKDQNDHIINLDKTLSAICIPYIGKKLGKYGALDYHKVCSLMTQLPILQANAIAVFFYRVWKAFLNSIPDCLERKIMRGETLTEQEAIYLAVAFHSDGDGSALLHKLQRWRELV